MEYIRIRFDGRMVLPTTWNCCVFVYPLQFQTHNHVYVVDGEPFYVFGNDELITEMSRTKSYCITWGPFPSDNDIAAYEQWRQREEEKEVQIQAFLAEMEDGINWEELG